MESCYDFFARLGRCVPDTTIDIRPDLAIQPHDLNTKLSLCHRGTYPRTHRLLVGTNRDYHGMTRQPHELAKFLDHKMIMQASNAASRKAPPKTDDAFDDLLAQLANAEKEVGTRKNH